MRGEVGNTTWSDQGAVNYFRLQNKAKTVWVEMTMVSTLLLMTIFFFVSLQFGQTPRSLFRALLSVRRYNYHIRFLRSFFTQLTKSLFIFNNQRLLHNIERAESLETTFGA